jgi:hypothetical protein
MKNSIQQNFTLFVVLVSSTFSPFSDIFLVEWKSYVVYYVTELHHIV